MSITTEQKRVKFTVDLPDFGMSTIEFTRQRKIYSEIEPSFSEVDEDVALMPIVTLPNGERSLLIDVKHETLRKIVQTMVDFYMEVVEFDSDTFTLPK